MDSPEVPETTSTLAAANSIGSPIVQESPFSNYLSNLSPIKPVKNSRILQGYADLSSPPLVFTSPHIVSKCEPSSLQRPRCPRMETPKGNVGKSYVDAAPDLEKCDSFLSSKSNVDIQKDGDHSSYSKEQHCSPSGFVDEYLSEPVDAECADCVQSVMTEPSVGPLGVANLQTNTLNGDADKEALPSSGQGSNNCALPSDGLPCETLPVQANEDYYEHVELEDPGASQQHRGMSRRCLQFEEAQGIVQGSAPAMNSPNSSTNLICTRLPFSSGGIENSKMLNPGISAPSGKRKMINLTRGIISIHPPNQNTKAKLSISRRSGIGLHLNSIVRASAMECNANESMKTHVEENERCSAQLSDSVEKVLTPVGDRMLENQAAPAPAAMTSTSDSLPTVKSADATQSFEPNEPPQEKKTISSEHSESFNEFNQSSPKKKMKKFTPDDNGCKRCNCKKTKCLKLYCDCFAAGIYCADSCSCQGCFNRPEYEDTVLETRQLIESRNPLAFAPKIVHQASKVHAAIGEEVNRTTPASARHKRGCNCKRSMCLKKYCECYQSSVGCSSGCRCEGCKNVFGRKEDYSIVEEIINTTTSNDARTDIVDEKSAMAIHSNDLLHTQPSDLHSPAPFTPHCQFSDHGNDAQKHRPFTTSYLPSPKPSSPTQPGGINGNGNPLAEIEDCRDMEFTIAEMIGEFSPPKLDPISDTCYLSPQEPPQFGGGRRVSSSLRWRGSPVTPTPCLGESKTHQGEEEEDAATTPDTVKESCNPIQSVKATSPNKKRVSISPPPHHPHSKAFDLRSVAAGGGFRSGSGRKFFLKGVPSFPSLSPCMMATELPKQQQHEEEKL